MEEIRKRYLFLYLVIWFYFCIFALCAYIGIYGIEPGQSDGMLLALSAVLGVPVSIVIFKVVLYFGKTRSEMR